MSRKPFCIVFLVSVHIAIVSSKHSSLIRRHIHSLKFAPYCKFNAEIINNDNKLSKVVVQSQYVFSGRVTSDVKYINNNKTILFDVFIKRFFKDHGDIKALKETKVSMDLQEGEGFKCRQVVRFRYTAIFIGNKTDGVDDVDIKLVINPVSITLTNLERINTITKGELYFLQISVATIGHSTRM